MSTQAQIVNDSVNADVESTLAEEIGSFTHDPLGYAYYAFPWGYDDLAESEGPRPWQINVMTMIGQHLASPETRYKPCQIAVRSGHGIGKSALVGMVISWALSTCEDCRVIVTANTKSQLDTKTVPEVGKWLRRAINASWWDVAATSVKAKQGNAQTWRADFIPWSDQNPQAFAGLHNKGKRILIVLDEASGIDDIIWEVVSGALTDENTEIIFLAFGNPEKSTGAFTRCFGDLAHRWKTLSIDARDVEGTNKDLFAEWIADYGIDSDWVRVRVLGLPPRASDVQFIDSDRVKNAQRRELQAVAPDEPLICGVDFAWGGMDSNVVRFRRGKDARSIPTVKVLGEFTRDPAVMTVKLSEILTQTYNGVKIHTMFVDSAGIAGNIVSRLRQLGFSNVVEVNFMADSPDIHYANMRAFMWGKMKDWLLTGCIDARDNLLAADLAAPGYRHDSSTRLLLEKKEDMKKRIGRSPDDGDALALTFPFPVAPAAKVKADYQPSFQNPSTSWMAS